MWLEWFKTQAPQHHIDLTLDRVQAVFKALSLIPPIVITVGGTNGKGSVVELLTHFFKNTGYQVGTYTSPHLHRLNERIRVNGEAIPDASFAESVESVLQQAEKIDTQLTFFEILTLSAFYYFQQQGCTHWILEVGMGGRLDAVNVVDATLGMITSIDWDHMAYLGNSLHSIAREKAGIARMNKPILLGVGAQKGDIETHLHAIGALVEREGVDFHAPLFSAIDAFPYLSTHIALANRAFEKIEGRPWQGAWTLAAPPGRFERKEQGTSLWIFDVAHNAESAHLLAQRLKALKPRFKRMLSCWHSLADKDLLSIVEPMVGIFDFWVIPSFTFPRAASQETLLQTLKLVNETTVVPCQIDNAFKTLTEYAIEDCCIVVWGGFNLVSRLREHFNKRDG